MLIILEGPDGSGKTTLAHKLADAIGFNVETRHYGPPTAHPLDEYLRPLTRYQPGRDHLVVDRFHWGEHVYPLARNRPTRLDPESWWAIENYLERLGAVVVQCTQYIDNYRDVYVARGESLEQLGELPLVDKLFDEARSRSVLPVTSYNWAAPSSANVGRILAVAASRQESAEELVPFTTYSGPRLPYVVLIGDVRHGFDPTSGLTNRDPAFVPFLGTSGHFLLSEAVRGQLDLGIANACDQDDVLKMLEVLGEPHVVALGRNAQRCLTKLSVPHAVVPHPQYVRRFHSGRRYEYGELITGVIGTTKDYATWPKSSKQSTASPSTVKSSNSPATVAAA